MNLWSILQLSNWTKYERIFKKCYFSLYIYLSKKNWFLHGIHGRARIWKVSIPIYYRQLKCILMMLIFTFPTPTINTTQKRKKNMRFWSKHKKDKWWNKKCNWYTSNLKVWTICWRISCKMTCWASRCAVVLKIIPYRSNLIASLNHCYGRRAFNCVLKRSPRAPRTSIWTDPERSEFQ